MNKETNPAVLLGRASWRKRTAGMSAEQIKKMMSKLKKGKKLTKVKQVSEVL